MIRGLSGWMPGSEELLALLGHHAAGPRAQPPVPRRVQRLAFLLYNHTQNHILMHGW